jgi:hypothetical protein
VPVGNSGITVAMVGGGVVVGSASPHPATKPKTRIAVNSQLRRSAMVCPHPFPILVAETRHAVLQGDQITYLTTKRLQILYSIVAAHHGNGKSQLRRPSDELGICPFIHLLTIGAGPGILSLAPVTRRRDEHRIS